MTSHPQHSILVGVDGSPNASTAAAWAVAVGRQTKARVKAVAAWTELLSPNMDPIDDHVAEMNTQTRDAAVEALHNAGIDSLEVTAEPGVVADVLINAADRFDASMLVVGTRGLGRLSTLLLGSISRYLLFTTRRPLVIVPSEPAHGPPRLTRVLVGIDRSSIAHRVASWSARLCADAGVPATIVRCADPGCERPPGHVTRVDDNAKAEAEEVLEPFRDLGVDYDIVVAHCDPRVALVETAVSTRSDMIVIGTRGEGQFRGLGGTASYLARHAPVPLAVIP